ncbi:MAG: VWA domain-containing protein [Vicinamibacterales bacterium]
MSLKLKGFWSSALGVAVAASLSAQAPAQSGTSAAPTTTQNQVPPDFRVQIDAVTMDVVVKDKEGRFVPDLRRDEFEIYEDGVKQEITSMTMSHGGRVSNLVEAPPPPPPEGIILPPSRHAPDTSGRIFLFFVDDLHLQFQNTGRVRELFKRIGRNLLHDGDLFGIVSSGPSSIHIDMTYDRSRLDEAINKMSGSGLKPSELIQRGTGTEGLSELRYNAQVAFGTMQEALGNLEKVHNRRKAIIWVSEGYDFNPFQDSRLGGQALDSPFIQNRGNAAANTMSDGSRSADPFTQYQRQRETFSDADLTAQLSDLTRSANRANTTIYPIDPRGLVGGTDIDEQVDPVEWSNYVRKSQNSMRVLAEQTGGLAVVNMNDFDKALKQIDASSSDYYVLGYYSTNPDPTKRRREVEVKVLRPDSEVFSRKEYVLRPSTPASAPAPAPARDDQQPKQPPPGQPKRR